ncbi:MAG: thiamine pyrophosphate-binding protein [Candidatus Bathyarchaeota archaeon]|nr:thiamine pyrophosphate-binding protein [Candidatus Bathyarchaeota archaeon]
MPQKVLSVGEYLLLQLKQLGISRVYGIPGDFVIKFFKLIEDDADLQLCTFSHEQGAGFAAVGEARALRRPALAVVTYGPGLLNMVNAVACAYAEKTPLVVVAGGPPLSARQNDFFMHHTVKTCSSMLEAASRITAHAVLLDDPESAAEKIAGALSVCKEAMLPVYIELPADVVNQKIRANKHSPASLPVDAVNLKRAADLITRRLASAEKPVVMAGVESDRFNLQEQILQLAKNLNLPVVSTMLARDHLPSADEPHYFGLYLGAAGNRAAEKVVAESDLVLVLGEMLSDVNLGAKLASSKRGEIVWCFNREVNVEEQVLGAVPLEALVAELAKARVPRKSWVFPVKVPLRVNRACKFTSAPLVMGEVVDAVNWLFSEYGEMPLVADTGNCLFASLNLAASAVLAPSFYGTMGFAVPAAIGYALAAKKRPLVMVGDGGFQMTGPEICHCPRYKINPIFLVVNNRRWGMEQLFYPSAGFNELVDWHYADIADLWGGKGYRCSSCEQLYRALEDAHKQECFTLIEVVTERDELSEELMAWISEQKAEG